MIDPLIDYMNASVGRPESLEELPACPICGNKMDEISLAYNEAKGEDEIVYICWCGSEVWESKCR